jgi:hypothetical protein
MAAAVAAGFYLERDHCIAIPISLSSQSQISIMPNNLLHPVASTCRLSPFFLCRTYQVTWTTGPSPPLQYIEYGFQPGNYQFTVPATQFVTYSAASLCGTFTAVNTFIDPGLFVTASITVQPGVKHYYRVGSLVRPQNYFGQFLGCFLQAGMPKTRMPPLALLPTPVLGRVIIVCMKLSHVSHTENSDEHR